MRCPTCEEGTLMQITLKTTKEGAFICNSCESLWFAYEKIAYNTGHSYSIVTNPEDKEYMIKSLNEPDEEMRDIRYHNYK